MEIRAMAIALFYVIGTALGGITGPIIFGQLIGTGDRGTLLIGYLIAAGLMVVAVHAPLISGPFSNVGSVVGALLAIVGGGWIALSVLRSPSAPREAEAEPRVR